MPSDDPSAGQRGPAPLLVLALGGGVAALG